MLKKQVLKVVGETAMRIDPKLSRQEKFESSVALLIILPLMVESAKHNNVRGLTFFDGTSSDFIHEAPPRFRYRTAKFKANVISIWCDHLDNYCFSNGDQVSTIWGLQHKETTILRTNQFKKDWGSC